MGAQTKTFKPITIVDRQNRPLGSMMLRDALAAGHAIRGVRVLVYRPDGELLLQQRSQAVVEPHSWEASAGGMVDAGETYEEAAHRELAEELGVENVQLQALGLVELHNEMWGNQVTCFQMVFKAECSDLLSPNDEVADLRWVSKRQLAEWLKARAHDFSSGFLATVDQLALLKR